ncbi:monosaccharide ABC transporter substrate-binding protein (CUT2 family) [Paenibacillus cellulosilyticus]|uniref:Monosaccharide ABC transporter substrate-binding protein (CUT2 family) n=1 Tax=Paenibacillus cellulosilyticus TaxID=375489 RepID=A0A2V2YZL8_9BACL|nr:autoinducer 2 ABC transporter substrate-binding protein [Paenibacillus cellulosilyticus]PWW07302.1 monosaccharide ABC transporter substrate-binding protein (CUT2 family) [Paenibacillus cellulosilyticus]QKS44511.1 autoinducer 2 ABC transporter substrate-binding protein [Paenibacillus cellulosilyticus]
MIRKLMLFMTMMIIVSACSSGSGTPYRIVYSMDTQQTTSEAVPDSSLQDQRYSVAIIPKGTEIDYFTVAAEGAQEAANDLDIDVMFEGPKTADVSGQIEVIDSMIQRHVDLIAVSANDPEALIPVLEKARQAGIKVISWDADADPQVRDFYVNMVDPETLGRHLMDTLANAMGEKGNFAILTGAISASNLSDWLKWIQVQHKAYYPEMNLVKVVATDDNLTKAGEVAKQLLAEHPELNGIIGNSSVGFLSAANAVKDAGKAGAVKVVGLSNPNFTRSYLNEGTVQMATLWSPKKLGYLTVVLANNLLNGVRPADGQDIPKVGKIRVVGDMVIMGEPLDFSKENVNQYDF